MKSLNQMNIFGAWVALTLLITSISGCGETEVNDAAMSVVGVSNNELVVGQTLEVYVDQLEDEAASSYRLFFEGQYLTDDGQRETVNFSQGAIFDGYVDEPEGQRQVLRISRLGPFSNPFATSGRPGEFTGTIRLIVNHEDGSTTVSTSSRQMSLNMGASITIEAFQPLDANCGAPALRALPGLAYQMRVRTTGIKPVRFIYKINRINGSEGITEFVHEYEGPVDNDILGEIEPVIFNPISELEQFYATGIRVIAQDEEGNEVETALPLSVHRPIEVIHSGKRLLAERYTPVPVSGCMPGSIDTNVRYSETRTEYRQTSVNLTMRRTWNSSNGTTQTSSWQEGISEGESSSETIGSSNREQETTEENFGLDYGNSEANRIRFETSDGESWNWSRREGETNTEYERRLNELYGSGSVSGTVSATAEGSVPGLAKASGTVSTTSGVKAGGSTGRETGTSRSRSTDRGFGMSGSTDESRGFGSTVTDSRSENVNGAYSLTSGRQQDYRDTSTRNESRTWDFSESASQSDVVSEGLSDSEARTWSESSSDRTVQAFSGRIPRGRVGVFYRQTTRWIRRAEVRSYNQCGLAEHVGELQFNEWSWAPDLSLGLSCDGEPPQSNFEAAACYIEPCG